MAICKANKSSGSNPDSITKGSARRNLHLIGKKKEIMNITEERVYEILKDEEEKYPAKWDGDNALQGLLILAKYIDMAKHDILGAAEHDIIYGASISDAVKAGITEEDVIAMRQLNWMEEYGSFACFV